MFQRTLGLEGEYELLPGSTSLGWLDIGGSITTPFLFGVLTINNIDEPRLIDFETAEYGDVGVIKLRFLGGVVKKIEITERVVTTPILVMTDSVIPKEYIYADTTAVVLSPESEFPKSGRNEFNQDGETFLPVIRPAGFVTITDFQNIAGVPRYALKVNHHFFANSILCDSIEIVLRPRMKSGVTIRFYNFL